MINFLYAISIFLVISTSCAIFEMAGRGSPNFVTPQPNKVTLAQAAACFCFMIWQFARERERVPRSTGSIDSDWLFFCFCATLLPPSFNKQYTTNIYFSCIIIAAPAVLGQPNLPNRCRVSCQRQLPLARQQWHWTWQRSLLTQTESGWIFTDLWISLFLCNAAILQRLFPSFLAARKGRERERERKGKGKGTTTGETHKST